MFPVLNIGPLALQAPGFFLILSVWIGISLSEKYAPRFRVLSQEVFNLVAISLAAGVVGARLAYLLRTPAILITNPLSIVSLNAQMLDVQGGALIGLLAVIIFMGRKKMDIWRTLDALVPLFTTTMVGLSLAHLASGDAYGAPTSVPWGIVLWGAKRHPAQVYELLMALLIGLAIFPGLGYVYRFWKYDQYPGVLFLVFLSLSASTRIFMEAFRGDSVFIGPIRSAQVVGWIILAVAIWLISKRFKAHE